MSAYQCSPEHIAFICAVYSEVWRNRRTGYMPYVHTSDLYAILSTANAESVAFRYREPVASYPRTVAFPKIDIATVDANIGAIFRSIACLEYQSCERDDWKDSNAFGLLQGLRDALLSRLPGADADSAWGLPVLLPAAPVAIACATVAPECSPGHVARRLHVEHCAAEIVCNPDEPKRWQLPIWRIAKGREDCRHIGSDNALTAPAFCA